MAISLQADGVYAAHVVRQATGKPVVEFAGFFPADGQPVKDSLEKMAKEVGIGRYCCTTLLGFAEYQLLTVDAPNVPPDELKTAVRWRLKDMLDYHIEDATIDVLDVPIDKNAASRNHSIFAIVARNQLIRERQEMFGDLKIPLSVIDIPEMAQRNVSALIAGEGRGVAFLSFFDDMGLLTVTYAGELYLSRRIDLPLSQLQLQDEEQRNACFDRITLELQRSLDHFDRQYHFISMSKLVLSPLGEAGPRLREYLATNLYVPVEELVLEDVLDLTKVPDLQQAEKQQCFFMTLGAALRHEETVL